MGPGSYQHAIDSGVYLPGVDTSEIGDRLIIMAEQIHAPAVFLIVGQSNGGNHGETRFAARGRVYNFNPFDGHCYQARDPLLGATGDGGSPWCLLGDALVTEGFAPTILLVPVSVGGSTVADWAPSGPYNNRLKYAVERVRAAGFVPTHVLWHQGEADALFQTSAQAYVSSFARFVESLRAIGVHAPVHLAIASYFALPHGYEASQTVIREAQQSLIDPRNGIMQGPDTDLIKDRFDACHMGTLGLRAHAEAWKTALGRIGKPNE
jgi:Carbohydrate esterase, sialic acid-specific acetylesterase